MSKLVSHVHVFDDASNAVVFGPDDEVPEWAAKQMGAHCFVDGEHPFPEPDDEPDDEQGSEPVPVPPTAGPGSSADAWTKYAESVGVTVKSGAKREDIVQALRDAGKPVE